MVEKVNDTNVLIDPSIRFKDREDCMYRGLLIYLHESVGEYLTADQISLLAESLRRLRNRPADVEYSDELCCKVSDDSEIRNRYIPRKLLRKDEGSVLFYNLAPYALLGRKHAASFAKASFPDFFASVATINSTFTKFCKTPGSEIDRVSDLSIKPFAEHSINAVESYLWNLGMQTKSTLYENSKKD